ncbi:MAG: hypothetical protein EOM72_05955 [Opitutae bacterium]|nr:hypothetical protein [Opitutae bacterium]
MTKSLFSRSQAKFLAVLAIGLAAGWAVSASAEIPANPVNIIPAGLVNYQGTLLTSESLPYTNGIYDIDFRIYPESSGGLDKALWGAGYKVFVNNGVFGVMLGQSGGTALNDNPTQFQPNELWKALWFDERSPDNLNLFLGITVKQDQNRNPIATPAEAMPRQQFLSTPFAARAQQAMYARRASGDFDVGGTLTATNGIVGNSANFSGTVSATAISGTTISGTNFNGSGANLTGVAKLAGGNVFSGSQTFSNNITVRGNLSISTNLYAASGKENLRIVRGSIFCTNLDNPDLAQCHGGGWFISNPVIGRYLVTFHQPFSDVPTVTAIPWGVDRRNKVHVFDLTATGFTAETYNSSDNMAKLSFHFIAVGPR